MQSLVDTYTFASIWKEEIYLLQEQWNLTERSN